MRERWVVARFTFSISDELFDSSKRVLLSATSQNHGEGSSENKEKASYSCQTRLVKGNQCQSMHIGLDGVSSLSRTEKSMTCTYMEQNSLNDSSWYSFRRERWNRMLPDPRWFHLRTTLAIPPLADADLADDPPWKTERTRSLVPERFRRSIDLLESDDRS